MMFDGFKSRWITPRTWAYAMVWATEAKIERKRGRSSYGDETFARICGGARRPAPSRARNSSASVRPFTSFIVKNGRRSANEPSS